MAVSQGQYISCPYCLGEGKIAETICDKCKGKGVIPLEDVGSGFILDDDDGYHD